MFYLLYSIVWANLMSNWSKEIEDRINQVNLRFDKIEKKIEENIIKIDEKINKTQDAIEKKINNFMLKIQKNTCDKNNHSRNLICLLEKRKYINFKN